MTWKYFYLILSAINIASTIMNYSDHEYYTAMLTASLCVVTFGLFINSLITDLITIPKPRKEEKIYE